jgi:serine/threonine-protein kinase HipA
MRQAQIFFRGRLAGILTEDEEGYAFRYTDAWLREETAEGISLTMPLTESLFHSRVLFPFFDGLIPEGWLLELAETSWKIDRRDRMGLLLACCKDCIGAVSVVPAGPETGSDSKTDAEAVPMGVQGK